MKKTVLRAAALLLLLCVGFAALFSCGPMETPDPDGENPEEIDYAAEVKLDMSADTLKQEVTVYNYGDGYRYRCRRPCRCPDISHRNTYRPSTHG